MPDEPSAISQTPPVRSLPGSSKRPLRVGVMLPYSTICPSLAESFVLGIRAALAHGETPVACEISVESIGAGGAATASRLGNLMAANRPDVIASMMGTGTIHLNDKELAGCGRPIINATLGANLIRPEHRLPNLLTLSAGTWQSAVAAGGWAAEGIGKKAFYISSFFDCGFDMFFAMRNAFETGGGELPMPLLLDSPKSPRSPGQALEEALASGAEVILSNLSGHLAEALVREWSSWPYRERIPLVGTAFLTEAPRLDALGQAAIGVKTVAGWCEGGQSTAATPFSEAFAEVSEDLPPDIFGILGWETGHLIREGLAAVSEPAKQPKDFIEALLDWKFQSPRGQLVMDRETGIATGPLYLREVLQTTDGIRHTVISELPEIENGDPRITPLLDTPHSGWANEYVCI